MAISEHIRRLREHIGSEVLLLPTVAVLPRDEAGRILLVKHAQTGLWATIGGYMEIDESPREAARREAEEEAGVVVQLGAILDVLAGPDFRMTYPNGDETACVSVVFEATVVGGKPTPDGDETSDVQWFASAELATTALGPFAHATFRTLGLLPS
jgi:ADP-ribose pyrophosphatase YjhB (NUDIX family)